MMSTPCSGQDCQKTVGFVVSLRKYLVHCGNFISTAQSGSEASEMAQEQFVGRLENLLFTPSSSSSSEDEAATTEGRRRSSTRVAQIWASHEFLLYHVGQFLGALELARCREVNRLWREELEQLRPEILRSRRLWPRLQWREAAAIELAQYSVLVWEDWRPGPNAAAEDERNRIGFADADMVSPNLRGRCVL